MLCCCSLPSLCPHLMQARQRMASEMWLCCYRACCAVWGPERQTSVENCDVQFCWWETVSSCFSMSGTVTRKKKMNPCKNYLSTFNFSLACTSEFSDFSQIKNQRLFSQGSTPLPSLLARIGWHWTCTDLSRREIEGLHTVPLCCVPGVCSGSVDFFFVLNLNRKCW